MTVTCSLSDIQKRRDAWVAYNFPGGKDTLITSTLGAVEELGELAHHILKRKQGIRKADHDAEIKDACADIIIYLLGVATHEGFDLGEVVSETWDRVEARDWIKFPGNGKDK